jgi:hypothetical protein
MLALRAEAPELGELRDPQVIDGQIFGTRDIPPENETNFFISSSDSYHKPPHIVAPGHVGYITYNPFSDIWYCWALHEWKPLTADQLFDGYSEVMARWIAESYPLIVRKRQEEQVKEAGLAALAQARKEQDQLSCALWIAGAFVVLMLVMWIA